jgi:hypothetical protein
MVVCDKGHHSKLGFASFSRFKNNLSNKQLKYPKLPKDYDKDEDDTQDSKPAAAKVARVSLDGKSKRRSPSLSEDEGIQGAGSHILT